MNIAEILIIVLAALTFIWACTLAATTWAKAVNSPARHRRCSRCGR